MIIKQPRQNTKAFTVIKHFATGGTLHRFQAERLGDHTLNSSVSAYSRAYGLNFKSVWVEVPTNFDRPVRVKQYWLEGDSLHKARLLTRDKIICYDSPIYEKPTLEVSPKRA